MEMRPKRPMGRDSVEPRSLPKRRNPSAGVHIYVDRTTIAFLTVCTSNRQRGLDHPRIHAALIQSWHEANTWLVGAYTIMPDHVHLFCSPQTLETSIEKWIAFWKRRFRRRIPNAPRFQSRGFHHRLRKGENYAEKWEYVRQNPVRAGLVRSPEDWPYHGILNVLHWDC